MILKMTRKKQKNNTSGVTGVSYESERNRWNAYITRNGFSLSKHFVTKEAAIEWRRMQEEHYKLKGILSNQ